MLNNRDDEKILESSDSEGRRALHHAIMAQTTPLKAPRATSAIIPKTTSWEIQNDASSRVADLLLAAGASATAVDLPGWTPLHHAAAKNRTAIIAALLAHGASSSVRATDIMAFLCTVQSKQET